MTATLLALAASLVYGTADFFGGLATRRADTLPVVVASQISGLLLLVVFLPAVASAADGADLAWGPWAMGSGLAGAAGVALLYHALASGRMTVVAPIAAVTGIAVPVLVGLGLGERPGSTPLIGVAVAAVAIVFISRGPTSANPLPPAAIGVATGEAASAKRPASPWRRAAAGPIGTALAAGVAIGGFYVCLQRTGRGGGLWPLVVSRSVAIVVMLAVAAIAHRSLRVARPAVPITLAAGAADVVANVCYLLAVRRGMLSIVATLASLYPASTVLLARVILGERVRPVQAAGLVLASVAVVLIAGHR